MLKTSIVQIPVRKVSGETSHATEDSLAIEEPLEIHLSYYTAGLKTGKSISVTMRTPGGDRELALGFLFTEGIIAQSSEVQSAGHINLDENRFNVELTPDAVPNISKTDRNFYTTSSCGVCGKSSIEAIKTVSRYQDKTDDICINSSLLHSLPDRLREQQQVFERTGGLHASALFDLNGSFLSLKEDVGRHNALDKLIGAQFLSDNLPLNKCMLLLSGRASFELVQKAAMAGIKIIAAVGAPSSLAAELAKDAGITLIGFLRNDRFNIYSGEQRIRVEPDQSSYK
jgi:FdhD protein